MMTILISDKEYKRLEKLALSFSVLSFKNSPELLNKAIQYQARIGIRLWLSKNGMDIK